MNSRFSILRVCVSALLLLSIAPAIPHTPGQDNTTERTGKNKLIAAAREIMSAARYCALVTLDARGHPQVRTMDPFPPDQDMVVWLGTNRKSRKVAEIRSNPRVVLYYFDPATQGYVTISGIARLVDDRREKAKRWKDEWKAFYPDREANYLVIAVTPEKLEIVCEQKGITGDAVNWDPPSVRFRGGRPND